MEPIFAPPKLPRYTQEPFPAYRYIPFQPGMPHPLHDPDGHSYGKDEDYLPSFSAADWRDCQPYLFGIDLFNSGYWWEAHEALESVWIAAGRETQTGQFVQGLIMVAAAQLKRIMGEERGARVLTENAVEKLSVAVGTYLGVEVAPLIAESKRCRQENCGEFPVIKLIF